jgi:NADPH:quinone reductase
MKSVIVSRYGGPEVLRLVESDPPVPKRGQVRIRVRAAGVSFADVLMRRGVYPAGNPAPPFTPGWDIVGTVDQLGEGVEGYEVGKRVAALTKVGGYSEALCLDAGDVVPLPDELDDAEAVSLILNYITAYQMLHRVALVRPGEQLLVDGAAGGVGSALLELARMAGAGVFGIASAAKHDFVRSLGAHPIDRDEDPAEAVRRTLGRGADAAFDGVGGWHLVRTLRAVRRGARVVPFGASSIGNRRQQVREYLGFGAALACAPLSGRAMKSYSISRMRERHPDWFREDLTALFEMLASGSLRPRIAAQLPLAQAARVHELLERGDVRGKIVLTCS